MTDFEDDTDELDALDPELELDDEDELVDAKAGAANPIDNAPVTAPTMRTRRIFTCEPLQ